MPNWTTCELNITGPAVELGRLLAIIQPDPEKPDDVAFFDRLHPMPPEYRHTVSGSNMLTAGDGLTWYEWQQQNWGVKWGDCSPWVPEPTPNVAAWAAALLGPQPGVSFAERPTDQGSLFLRFDTPWGLASEGLAEIASRWPTLTFAMSGSYEDGGSDEAYFEATLTENPVPAPRFS